MNSDSNRDWPRLGAKGTPRPGDLGIFRKRCDQTRLNAGIGAESAGIGDDRIRICGRNQVLPVRELVVEQRIGDRIDSTVRIEARIAGRGTKVGSHVHWPIEGSILRRRPCGVRIGRRC